MNVASAFTDGRLPGVSPGIYSADDFAKIAELIYAESGNVLHQGKAMLVYSRIAPLVRKSGSATFAEFIALIGKDAEQRKRAVDALTTNHTFFFREGHHFEHLAKTVRPRMLEHIDAGERVRLWSAGCSSGEETWSIALTLLGEDRAAGQRLARSDIKMLASDLAHHVLARATAGVYGRDDVKEVPEALRRNWLRENGNEVSVGEEARSIVRFRELNLMGDWPMREPFDVIFCRNVMIYFDQPTKERLVSRFAAQLRPGGFLYIGHSERVAGPASAQLDVVGPTIYRRRTA